MVTTVATLESNDNLRALLERVEKGETITITRHGVPVARLMPAGSAVTREEKRELIESWKQLRVGNNLGDDLTIRDLIDEGRR